MLYSLITAIKPRNVLEFGTGRGYGALSMARAILDSNLDSHIYSIDFRLFDETQAWPVDYGTGPKVDKTSLKQVWTKYFPSELISKITLLNGTSETIIKDWHAKNLPAPDFAFIDGGHDYNTVKSDTINVIQHIKKPGWIFWHDYDVINDFGKYLTEISNKFKEVKTSVDKIKNKSVRLENLDVEKKAIDRL